MFIDPPLCTVEGCYTHTHRHRSHTPSDITMLCHSYHISEDICVSNLTPVTILTHHTVQYYNIVILYNMYNIV